MRTLLGEDDDGTVLVPSVSLMPMHAGWILADIQAVIPLKRCKATLAYLSTVPI